VFNVKQVQSLGWRGLGCYKGTALKTVIHKEFACRKNAYWKLGENQTTPRRRRKRRGRKRKRI
jgi:hypothetical protein